FATGIRTAPLCGDPTCARRDADRRQIAYATGDDCAHSVGAMAVVILWCRALAQNIEPVVIVIVAPIAKRTAIVCCQCGMLEAHAGIDIGDYDALAVNA